MNEQYLIYLLVATGYIASPGPSVLVAINQGATIGVKKSLAILFGNTTGLGILAVISSLGIGSIIIDSPLLSGMMKIIGGIWIFYMGFKMLASDSQKTLNVSVKNFKDNGLARYKDGVILALTNPKPIIFFLSIFPQFINEQEKNSQLLLLSGTFLVLSFSLLTAYSIISSLTFGKVLNSQRIMWFNRSFGVLFMVLALYLIGQQLGSYIGF